jgi:hypothetical protein
MTHTREEIKRLTVGVHSRKKQNKKKSKSEKTRHENQKPNKLGRKEKNKTSDPVQTQINGEKFDSCRIEKQPAVKQQKCS